MDDVVPNYFESFDRQRETHAEEGKADALGTKSLEYGRGIAQFINEQHAARAGHPGTLFGLSGVQGLRLHEAEAEAVHSLRQLIKSLEGI